MGTEVQLVWDIIETAGAGLTNDDSRLDERTIRSFVQAYRAESIYKLALGGQTISDECFQYLGPVQFNYARPKQFIADLPKIIRLDNRYGIMLEKNGENVPVVGSEEFNLSLKNYINGRLPKAKFLGKTMTVFIGAPVSTSCGGLAPSINEVIDDFHQEFIDSAGTYVTLDVNAVLHDTDDCPGYDWTVDPFPVNSELYGEIKKNILQREFNIWLNVKPDKVTDGNQEATKPTV